MLASVSRTILESDLSGHPPANVFYVDSTGDDANDGKTWNSAFANQEDAIEPTDYLLINVANTTGFVTGCRFATATNAATKLTVAAGVIWSANATEAGWSTGRPA